MKLAEVALLVLMLALTKAQIDEWQLNQGDAIVLARQGPTTVSLWQCGTLKQQMADLTQYSAESQFQNRGQNVDEVNHYLERQWREAGCEQLMLQQSY